VPRDHLEAAIATYAPTFKATERAKYRILGKKWRQHKDHDLQYFLEFLRAPLGDACDAKLAAIRAGGKGEAHAVEVRFQTAAEGLIRLTS